MGQFLSLVRSYDDNNALVNAMAQNGSICTEIVEKVLRSVDRGFYCNPDDKDIAYRDFPYQRDNIYLFSPRTYAISLECLELQKGQKFLNIGSGVGYFSTLAGLLLGDSGVNHGIEIDQELINLAYQKLEEFKLNAAAIDHFQFCEPVFIHGNVCELSQVNYYDKVYCEVDVPDELVMFMKSLIVIGGILVMTLQGYLVRVTRLDDISYETTILEDVEAAPFVLPNRCTYNTVKFPSVQPLSLLNLCRFRIRSILRDTLPDLIPSKSTSEESLHLSHDSETKEEPLPEGILNAVADLKIQFNTRSTALVEENDSDDSLSKSKEPDTNHTESLVAAREQSAKRKLEELGGFEQNHTSEKPENPKRTKMLSQNSDYLSSTSSQFDRDLEPSNSFSSITSVSQCSKDSNNDFNEDNSLWTCSISDSEVDDDISNDFKDDKYNFIFEHNKNKFSQLLKAKIDSLQLPGSVKFFLNYNRTD